MADDGMGTALVGCEMKFTPRPYQPATTVQTALFPGRADPPTPPGCTPTLLKVYRLLLDEGKPLTSGKLARMRERSRWTLRGQLKRLERLGLVEHK
jgi:hypothetical protein